VATYGEIDELNAQIGLLSSSIQDPAIRSTLEKVQILLFEAGAELATSPDSSLRSRTIRSEDVTELEGAIDRIEEALPRLSAFILPGGSEAAGRAHLARCVCRRAERAVVGLLRAEPSETDVLAFLNRLSDYLFVVARWANREAGIADTTWKKRESSETKSGGPERET
jgi:cob(I)alamin adenosyltransferase